MQICETTFVVTDTETTGGSAADDRLIEIGAVKVCDGRIVDRYTSLVNPGRSVPGRITRLTGISTAMVFDQRPAKAVLPEFRRFLGDAVFVAHNLAFDWRFINVELDRCDQESLDNRALCTLRLARRVLRGLRSKGLSSLSDHYGISIDRRHRALDDAEATAIILTRLISAIEFEHGVSDLSGLLSFQRLAYGSTLEDSEHVKRIRHEILPVVPRRPGVYFMRNRAGRVIYVGKAKNLRSRVRTYFTAVEAHPPRTRRLVRETRDVTWKETGSELGALLEESRLIKELQPRHNRALRRYSRRPFIKLDFQTAFPRVGIVQHVIDDGAEYFGPVHGTRNAARLADMINAVYRLRECDDATMARGRVCMYAEMGRCLAPCVHPEVEYSAEVERVRRFLMGRDDTIRDLLESRMREAADRLEFEEAREYRDWIEMLDRTIGRQREIAAPVMDHNAVVVESSVRPDSAQLFFVRFGRFVYNMQISRRPEASERARLREAISTFFNPTQLRPLKYHRQEADEITILLNWIHARRDSVTIVRWYEQTQDDAFTTEVCAALTSADVFNRKRSGRAPAFSA